MGCDVTVDAHEIVLQFSGFDEPKVKKKASPVRIALSSIERVERLPGKFGLEWCRIVVRGRQIPADLRADVCAFQYGPQARELVEGIEATVATRPSGQPAPPPPSVPPVQRHRSQSSFLDWLSGG